MPCSIQRTQATTFSADFICRAAGHTHTHVSHRQQALIKEEDDPQEGEQESEGREAHADFCIDDISMQSHGLPANVPGLEWHLLGGMAGVSSDSSSSLRRSSIIVAIAERQRRVTLCGAPQAHVPRHMAAASSAARKSGCAQATLRLSAAPDCPCLPCRCWRSSVQVDLPALEVLALNTASLSVPAQGGTLQAEDCTSRCKDRSSDAASANLAQLSGRRESGDFRLQNSWASSTLLSRILVDGKGSTMQALCGQLQLAASHFGDHAFGSPCPLGEERYRMCNISQSSIALPHFALNTFRTV